MIYPQRDNRRKRNKLVTVAAVIGSVLLLIIILNAVNPNLFTPMLTSIGRPIVEARGGFLGSINTTWQFFHSKTELVAENNALKQRASLMQAVVMERDYYKSYNAELLRRAGQLQQNNHITFARIISKPGFSPYDTMLLDVGRAEDISVGDHVLASDSIILGEIKEVYEHTSLVSLYSSPDKETPVLIGTQAIQAIMIGKGGGNFEIKLPRNTEVKEGDIVVMASSTPKIFGKIELINTSPTDTFERALLKNAVDVTQQSVVSIEKKL